MRKSTVVFCVAARRRVCNTSCFVRWWFILHSFDSEHSPDGVANWLPACSVWKLVLLWLTNNDALLLGGGRGKTGNTWCWCKVPLEPRPLLPSPCRRRLLCNKLTRQALRHLSTDISGIRHAGPCPGCGGGMEWIVPLAVRKSFDVTGSVRITVHFHHFSEYLSNISHNFAILPGIFYTRCLLRATNHNRQLFSKD